MELAPPYGGNIDFFINLISGNTQNNFDKKHSNRTIIATPQGLLTLTVPVVGGRSVLKRLPPEQIAISSHGDWKNVHIGAWMANYGRTPYFEHYFPQLMNIYENLPSSLGEFNKLMFLAAAEMLHIKDYSLPELLVVPKNVRYDAAIDEEEKQLSIFHLLFLKGPTAVLSLIPS